MASRYVNLCTMNSIVSNGIFYADLGSPAANSDLFTITVTATSAGYKDLSNNLTEMDATYGRTVTVVSSVANTSVVTVKGFDYLHQPMTETLTLNGSTKVEGKKAFKVIQSVSIPAGTAATITVGTGGKLGMPVRCVQVLATIEAGVKGTPGTLSAPINTKQTATTSDPRGLLQFTLSGKHLQVIGVADSSSFTIDDKLVGGLYGIPHYQ